MTKKYKSRSSLLRIAVCVNGELQDIEFTKSNLGHGLIGSAYVTDNKDVQKALESHEYFNVNHVPSFWTDDVEPVQEKIEPVKEEYIVKEDDASAIVEKSAEESVDAPYKTVKKHKYNKRK